MYNDCGNPKASIRCNYVLSHHRRNLYAADKFRPNTVNGTCLSQTCSVHRVPSRDATKLGFVGIDFGFCSLGFVGIDSFCLSRSGLTPNEDFLGTPKQSKKCER